MQRSARITGGTLIKVWYTMYAGKVMIIVERTQLKTSLKIGVQWKYVFKNMLTLVDTDGIIALIKNSECWLLNVAVWVRSRYGYWNSRLLSFEISAAIRSEYARDTGIKQFNNEKTQIWNSIWVFCCKRENYYRFSLFFI